MEKGLRWTAATASEATNFLWFGCVANDVRFTDFSINIRHGHSAMLEEWAEVIAGV